MDDIWYFIISGTNNWDSFAVGDVYKQKEFKTRSGRKPYKLRSVLWKTTKIIL